MFVQLLPTNASLLPHQSSAKGSPLGWSEGFGWLVHRRQIGLAGPSEKRTIRKEAVLDLRLFIILKLSMSKLLFLPIFARSQVYQEYEHTSKQPPSFASLFVS